METPIHIFEPDTTLNTTISLIFGALTVLLIWGLWYIQNREMTAAHQKRKGLYSIWLFFGLLICGGTLLFNLIYGWGLRPVQFFEHAVELPEGKILYEDIQQAYIHQDKNILVQTPSKNDQLLVIVEFSRKTHVLSEKNYPIGEIIKRLEERRKKD